jgi:menaquinone-dependent protoporphyrinogen oxidase
MNESEPRILVAYHSVDGQTAKIAQRIAETMRAGGADVEVRDVDDAPPPGGFDVAVVGDSIRMHHSRALRHYVERHVEALNAMPAALFQVSMTSATHDPEHEALARKKVSELLDDAGFDPKAVGMFAGALQYTKYGWITRRVMKSISAHEGRETDTSQDYEYTDWDAVDEFARAVLALSGSIGG